MQVIKHRGRCFQTQEYNNQICFTIPVIINQYGYHWNQYKPSEFVAESLVRRETICDNKQRDIIRVILVISNREITIQRDDFLQQTERYYPCKDRRYFLQRATDIGYQRETD
eukprot:68982_1